MEAIKEKIEEVYNLYGNMSYKRMNFNYYSESYWFTEISIVWYCITYKALILYSFKLNKQEWQRWKRWQRRHNWNANSLWRS